MKEIINPYNQETLATVTVGDKEDAVHAIKSAKLAFENEDWRQYTGEERGNVLFEIAILLEEYKTSYKK